MGKIRCSKHGDTGMAIVCSHIRKTVLECKPVTDFQLWTCNVEDVVCPFLFCHHCLDALRTAGLPVSGWLVNDENDDELLERVFKKVAGTDEPVCGLCLDECIALVI